MKYQNKKLLTAKDSLKYLKFLRENLFGAFWCWWYPDKYILTEISSPIIGKATINSAFKGFSNIYKGPVGLYVNIPFCETKCKFCHYPSEINSDEKINAYIKNLKKEIELKQEIIDFKKINFSALQIGGGTPTLLSAEQLERLLNLISSNFSFKPGAQRSIESEPKSLDWKKIKILESFKTNRISLGIESFDDHILKYYNRNSRLKDILKSYRLIKRSKIKNINIDLLLGLNGETKNIRNRYIFYINKLKPNQVTYYEFYPEASTSISLKEKIETYERIRKIEDSSFPEITKQMFSIGYKRAYGHDKGYYFIRKRGIPNMNILNGYKYFGSTIGLGYKAETRLYLSDGSLALLYNSITKDVPEYNNRLNTNTSNLGGLVLDKHEVLRKYLIYNFAFCKKIKTQPLIDFFGSNFIAVFKDIFNPLIKDKMIKITEKYIILMDRYKKLNHGHNLTEREKFFVFTLNYLYSNKALDIIKGFRKTAELNMISHPIYNKDSGFQNLIGSL